MSLYARAVKKMTALKTEKQSANNGRRRLLLSLLAIGAVLTFHAWLRCQQIPAEPKYSVAYPHCYSSALSVLAGRGFQRLPIASETASAPVRAFLDLDRKAISSEEFDKYLQSIPHQQSCDIGSYAMIDPARILDLYTAALVWHTFGISWLALQLFYVGVSTAACAAILFTVWKISGDLRAGLLAALLLAISADEGFAGVYNMRDTNPLWFGAFGLFVLVCVVNEFRNAWLNLATFLLLGVVATIGTGWRMDNIVYIPFLIAAACIKLKAAHVGLRFGTAAVSLACLASMGTHWAIQNSHSLPKNEVGNAFHVAIHGGEARANILGIENGLQTFFDDSKVASDAFAWHAAHAPEQPFAYCGGTYGQVCFEMYLSASRYNLFDWVRGMPKIAVMVGMGGPNPQNWVPSTHPFWSFVKPLLSCSRLAGCLFLFGLLAPCVASVDRRAFLTVLALLVLYSAIWFSVSPFQRHFAPILVPLYIIGGMSAVVIPHLYRDVRAGNWKGWLTACRLRPVRNTALATIGACILLAGVSFAISAHERSIFLEAIHERSPLGVDISHHIVGSRQFSIEHPPEQRNCAEGYLLTIRAGANPGKLLCRQLRITDDQLVTQSPWQGSADSRNLFEHMRKAVWWNSYYETSHLLAPNQVQSFVVTFHRTSNSGDHRHYKLKIAVGDGAEIISATRVPLDNWQHLPVCTVYRQNDYWGLAYRPGGYTSRTLVQFPSTFETLAELGFPEVANVARQSTPDTVRH